MINKSESLILLLITFNLVDAVGRWHTLLNIVQSPREFRELLEVILFVLKV